MKRSEMIDKIGDYLAIDGVVLKTALHLDDIAKEIVDLVEEAGMLPPIRFPKLYEGAFDHNAWEPEESPKDSEELLK
jgi:hypothetical protein